MTIETHYSALIEKHRKVEALLSAELRRPLPDNLAVQRLKRQKLRLKDEIESSERLLAAIRVRPVFQAGYLDA